MKNDANNVSIHAAYEKMMPVLIRVYVTNQPKKIIAKTVAILKHLHVTQFGKSYYFSVLWQEEMRLVQCAWVQKQMQMYTNIVDWMSLVIVTICLQRFVACNQFT